MCRIDALIMRLGQYIDCSTCYTRVNIFLQQIEGRIFTRSKIEDH
jgi:hypothetical protein